MNFKASEPCAACGLDGDNMVCYHHIYTQKAYPEFKFEKFNLVPMCQKHHNEIHSSSLRTMAVKYPGIKDFLVNNGYEFNEFLGKWTHPARSF
jgi:hypothetical protein